MNAPFDMSDLFDTFIKSVPLWAIVWFMLQRYFRQADKRQELSNDKLASKDHEIKITIKEMQGDIQDIKLSLAGLGVKEVKDMLRTLMRKDFEHDSKLDALFKLADSQRSNNV